MYVSRIISYLDGWEHLQLNKPNVYEDILFALENFTQENLTSGEITRPYNRNKVERPITPYSLTHCMDYFLREKGWDDYRVKPAERGGLYLYAKNLKDAVSVRLLASDRMPSFANWLFVEGPKLHEAQITDLSILLVPEDEITSIFEKERHHGPIFTMNRCSAQLKDLSPIKNSAPFVIIGFSPQARLDDLSVEEILPDESVIYIDKNVIEKSIEFPPEHYQAGIGILSYFGEVLKAKHPESNAKIRIEQDDGVVRLHIHSPNGDKEIIEKTLEEYTLVVAEKMPAQSLFDDDLQVMALENKLEIAKMEVRQTQRMLTLTQQTSTDRIRTLEEEVSFMRRQMANQLSQLDSNNALLSKTITSNDRLVKASINQNEKLLDDLIERSWFSKSVVDALEHIKTKLDSGVKDDDEKEIKESLIVIRDNAPEIIPDLEEMLKNTLYGVSGNTVFQWLQSICSLIV